MRVVGGEVGRRESPTDGIAGVIRMWIDRVVKWLLPREEHFFDLLERGACLAREIGTLLVECCAASPGDREALVGRIAVLVAARTHDGLERDSSNVVHREGESVEIADLVLVDATFQGRHEIHEDAGLPRTIQRSALLFAQVAAVEPLVNVLPEAGEGEVQLDTIAMRRDSLDQSIVLMEPQSIGIDENASDRILKRRLQDLDELWMDGRLAAA